MGRNAGLLFTSGFLVLLFTVCNLAGCGGDKKDVHQAAVHEDESAGRQTDSSRNDIIAQNTITTTPDTVTVATTDSLGEPPDIQFIDIDSISFSLSDYRGSVVMVDFWTMDCEPCKEQFEFLKELLYEFRPEGFEIIGVSMGWTDEAAALRRFGERHKLPFPLVLGAEKYNLGPGFLNSLPISYIYDRDGWPVSRIIGYHDKEFYKKQIKKALNNT